MMCVFILEMCHFDKWQLSSKNRKSYLTAIPDSARAAFIFLMWTVYNPIFLNKINRRIIMILILQFKFGHTTATGYLFTGMFLFLFKIWNIRNIDKGPGPIKNRI